MTGAIAIPMYPLEQEDAERVEYRILAVNYGMYLADEKLGLYTMQDDAALYIDDRRVAEAVAAALSDETGTPHEAKPIPLHRR